MIISHMLLTLHKSRNVPSLFLQQLIHLSPYWYWEFWPAVTSPLKAGPPPALKVPGAKKYN